MDGGSTLEGITGYATGWTPLYGELPIFEKRRLQPKENNLKFKHYLNFKSAFHSFDREPSNRIIMKKELLLKYLKYGVLLLLTL